MRLTHLVNRRIEAGAAFGHLTGAFDSTLRNYYVQLRNDIIQLAALLALATFSDTSQSHCINYISQQVQM